MAKRQSPQHVVLQKCENCGRTLPVDEHGIPVTSVYFNGHWLCPDCKFDKDATGKLR